MITRFIISVRNIPWTVSHLDLEKYFSAYGGIKYAKVVFDKRGLSTGCGFVEFYDAKAMTTALREAHVLEQGKLSVASGTQYLCGESLKFFLENYIQDESMQIAVIESVVRNKDATVEKRNDVKTSNLLVKVQNDGNLIHGNEQSIVRKLLRGRNSLR